MDEKPIIDFAAASMTSLGGRGKGFTLIELSIVLVIVGLIVGGVLAGQDLMEAARLRAVISQVERYKTAVVTFKLKYDSLPGDMPNATKIWPEDPAQCVYGNPGEPQNTCNGNGDGVIGAANSNDPNFANKHYETFLVWNHLTLAHLIEGSYAPVAKGITYYRFH